MRKAKVFKYGDNQFYYTIPGTPGYGHCNYSNKRDGSKRLPFSTNFYEESDISEAYFLEKTQYTFVGEAKLIPDSTRLSPNEDISKFFEVYS